jgi:cytoskeleton protein RodZ
MGKLGQWVHKTDQTSEQEEETLFSETQATRGELGALLRQTREEKRVSLEQIEEHTRIRRKYLLALEEARYEDLPTPGHIHGFLRNYARYLDLDMEEVDALYTRDRAAHRRFEPRIFQPKNITLLPKQPLIKADMVLSIVIVVLLSAAGFLFWQYGWPIVRPLLPMVGLSVPMPTATLELPTLTQPAPTRVLAVSTSTSAPAVGTDGIVATEAATATSTLEPTSTLTPVPTATPTLDSPLVLATPTPEPTSTPTPTPTRAAGVVVTATFVDRVWLQVTIDGQESPGSMYEAGDEEEWTANDTIYMICGNAGGIEVAVNGDELGVLGARAEVVEKLWGPQGEMTPTPIAPQGPSLGTDGTPTATPVPGQAG